MIKEKRHDLITRAKKLKAEREKAALLKADFSEEEKRVFEVLENAKKTITAAIENAQTMEAAAKTSRAAAHLYYAYISINRYKTRDYSSISEKRGGLEYITSDLQKVFDDLEGKQ